MKLIAVLILAVVSVLAVIIKEFGSSIVYAVNVVLVNVIFVVFVFALS